MTTPPTPEAVEAAMKYTTFKGYSAADFAALNDHSQDPCEPTIGTAARILAAEVERMRDVCKRQGIDLMAFTGEIAELRANLASQQKLMSQWLNRRASVEDVLYSVAAGKRGPLTPEEYRELAIKLGVPEK